MGELLINHDRLADFLSTLLEKLSGPQSRAAFWFYHPVELPIPAESLSGASPFLNSGSSLAGDGYLVHFTRSNAATVAAFFAEDLDALSALTHLEVESAGQLQFRSYDNFGVNLPGPALDAAWLKSLALLGIVTID